MIHQVQMHTSIKALQCTSIPLSLLDARLREPGMVGLKVLWYDANSL